MKKRRGGWRLSAALISAEEESSEASASYNLSSKAILEEAQRLYENWETLESGKWKRNDWACEKWEMAEKEGYL